MRLLLVNAAVFAGLLGVAEIAARLLAPRDLRGVFGDPQTFLRNRPFVEPQPGGRPRLRRREDDPSPTKRGSAHLCIADPAGRLVNNHEGWFASLLGTHPPIAKAHRPPGVDGGHGR